MKKTIITISIIFLTMLSGMNFVSAENETESIIANPEEELKSRFDDEVLAEESGNFNISFDDGYNGYCINYGKHEAITGDSFSVEDTSKAVNNHDGENVGNYLKTYFVDYYDHAIKDKIVTQHTIWHFTDNFNGWRLDYDLIEEIKATASTKTIPDHGAVRKVNNTTEMVFDFEVLNSGDTDHQSYFGYKITYREILPEIMESNETFNSEKHPLESSNETLPDTSVNSTEYENKTNYDNIEETENKTTEDLINDTNNSPQQKIDNNNNTDENERELSKNRKVNLSKHVTGHGRTIGLLLFALLLCFVAIKCIRD